MKAIADAPSVKERIAAIEKRIGGRLGVAALDTGTGKRIEYRADERFAMCSTFKFLAVAAVLKRVDAGQDSLDRRIPYGPRDLQDYAPVAKQHIGEGAMSLSALCEAAIEYSDNTAANLILPIIGGPAGVTRFARSIGDPITRLDRTEPTLNVVAVGDPRDTTSPSSMQDDMNRILLGDVLSARARELLVSWLVACKTGDGRIRAGVPSGWRVGDKTGTWSDGGRGSANDIAILWPPNRPPILVTSYLTDAKAPADARNAAHAEIGRIVSETM